MMNIVSGTPRTLSHRRLHEMALYRNKVFVQTLGWNLQVCDGMELDQFDRSDTVYVLACKDDAGLLGMARLLPTHKPYLLADVFPQLLGGQAAPCSPRTWELSRFAALDPDDLSSNASVSVPAFGASNEALALLDHAMAVAAGAGATQLVSVSPLGIERLLRRAGVVAQRLAPPLRIQGQWLFACCIDLTASLRQRSNGSSIMGKTA